MPIAKPIIKAARQNAKRRIANLKIKNKYKNALKTFRKFIAAGKTSEAIQAMRKAASAIDKAVKKRLIHKNKSARLKSRMAKALQKISG